MVPSWTLVVCTQTEVTLLASTYMDTNLNLSELTIILANLNQTLFVMMRDRVVMSTGQECSLVHCSAQNCCKNQYYFPEEH